MSLRYLTARLAQQVDEELMSSSGAFQFSIDQLMELAGLACAQTLAAVYPRSTHPRVLVCCGPGNQGGDGLVAARHLGMFGYKPTIYMPKKGGKDIYERLTKQCESMQIPFVDVPTGPGALDPFKDALGKTDVVLDAIFGFSFKPPVRPPFDGILSLLAELRDASSKINKTPIVSVDIPSGWDVETGPEGNDTVPSIWPNVLVSLTAPKLGAAKFEGRHFLGGRFVPRVLEEKYNLNLPEYPGSSGIVELPRAPRM